MMKMISLLSVTDFFVTEFLNRELPAFSNLSNTLTAWDINRGVGLFFLLLIFATGVLVWRKTVLEALPRKLLAEQITSPDLAKTAAELGLKLTMGMRFALRGYGNGIRMYVRYVGEKEPSFEKKKWDKTKQKEKTKQPFFRSIWFHFFPDLSDTRFYLNPDRCGGEHGQLAEKKFAEYGFTPKVFLYTSFFSVLLFFVLCRLMPNILLLIDSLL